MYDVLNRLWSRECRIIYRKLSDFLFLFYIFNKNIRKWVIKRGVWYIDDCFFFIVFWNRVNFFKIF